MLGACPTTPPPPTGYRVWNESVDGTPPASVVQLATQLAFHSSQPFGYMETICVGGQPLIVRVDPHPWSHDAQGNIIYGCFHGATVYIPTSPTPCAAETPTMQPNQSWSTLQIVESVFLATSLFTLAFTVGRSYIEHKHARQAYEDNVRRELRSQLMQRRS